MEWKHVEAVQEFTAEGQCSKIKVRSCRITWDSQQVISAVFLRDWYVFFPGVAVLLYAYYVWLSGQFAWTETFTIEFTSCFIIIIFVWSFLIQVYALLSVNYGHTYVFNYSFYPSISLSPSLSLSPPPIYFSMWNPVFIIWHIERNHAFGWKVRIVVCLHYICTVKDVLPFWKHECVCP